MYKIFKDKERTFKCNVDVQGADINDCRARLIFESESGIFMLKGDIDKNGICKITVPKEKMLSEGVSGNITLEVIAENTIFEAWNDRFEVLVDKKVSVVLENFEEPTKNSIKEEEAHGLRISASFIDEEEEVIEENIEEELVEDVIDFESEIEEADLEPLVQESNNNKSKEKGKEEILNFDSFLNKK